MGDVPHLLTAAGVGRCQTALIFISSKHLGPVPHPKGEQDSSASIRGWTAEPGWCAVKITLFGLTLSSSWGNGHATPYRAILRALHRLGHRVTFYERDVPYYARHRDFLQWDYCDLKLYSCWDAVRGEALAEAAESDVVMTASYVPEGARIADELLSLDGPLRVFYDLDTPITLQQLKQGDLDYLRAEQLPHFDLVLSWTGGDALSALQLEFGVTLACPLFGCVDPDIYHPVHPRPGLRCELSYMGTYAADRQAKLESMFLEPALRRPASRFLLAGPLYPADRQWPANVVRTEHVPPADHPGLYCSSRLTLNLTREAMAASGYCPSGRFFEAAACGTPIVTDWFRGLDSFFTPGLEVLVARDAGDVLHALDRADLDLLGMARRARERTLDEHTGYQRALSLLSAFDAARLPSRRPSQMEAA
jgi:spore maturation protein CgeB